MTRDVHDAIAPHAADYEVRGELHTVPPHAVYEVCVDGTRAVCKLARGPEADPATEARVIRYAGRETSIPVPEVLAVGEDYFVARWHRGVPDDPSIDPDRARAMGAGLATLHAETEGAFPTIGLLESRGDGLTLDARDSWADALRARLKNCRDYLDRFGYDDVATDVIAFLRERPTVLAGASAANPVLVHGNYLIEHVGIDDDEVSCVIDFEHALVGAGEYDYWSTYLPTFGGSHRPADAERRAAFRAGYESVRSLPNGFDRRAAVYRVVLTVTYLRSLYLQRNWESRAEADRRAESMADSVRAELDSLRADHE